MKGIQKRITIVPQGIFKSNYPIDLLKFIKGINNVIDCVDHDLVIKNACSQALLKKNRIKNFKGVDIKEFHQSVLDCYEDPSGTKFLIFKN